MASCGRSDSFQRENATGTDRRYRIRVCTEPPEIDLCLHMIRRDYGSAVASHAARLTWPRENLAGDLTSPASPPTPG